MTDIYLTISPDITVKHQLFWGDGDNLKRHKIWEMCYEHLAGSRQKMSKITEKAKCGNLK
jgi:hypothetical protein